VSHAADTPLDRQLAAVNGDERNSASVGTSAHGSVTARRHGKRADMLVHEDEPFNAEPRPRALAGSAITPLDAFYVRGHGPIPELDARTWRLQIGGLTERHLELSLQELHDGRFTERKLVATLQCAGNRRADLIAVRDIPGEAPWGPGATGTATWRGVSLAEVIATAGVHPAAAHVAFLGTDRSEEATPPQPFGASIPLAKAQAGEVLLAYEMDGQPLQPVHGAPLRVIVPGYIGARSVKWLRRIELRSEPWDGYFQNTAYRLLATDEEPGPGVGMALGEVGLNAAILVPEDGARLPAGSIELRGYALAGGKRRIARVDVSRDGGTSWIQADLLDDQGPWTWRLWRAQLELPTGHHEIVARAWDDAAQTQPERPETVWNPKGYANSSWARIQLHADG
jgi:sulfite oxidase